MIKWTDYIGVTVSAIVYHPEKWLLLWHRTDKCRDEWWTRDNWWGGLEFGETIREGIQRELVEEFGREFSNDQIYNLGYREQFRQHEGHKTHRIAFYHLIILLS